MTETVSDYLYALRDRRPKQSALDEKVPLPPVYGKSGVGYQKNKRPDQSTGIASPLTLQSRVTRTETITITPDMTFIEFEVTESRQYFDANSKEVVIDDELTV